METKVVRTLTLCLLVVVGCNRRPPTPPPTVVPPAPVPTTSPSNPHPHTDPQDPDAPKPIDEKDLAVAAIAEPEWTLHATEDDIKKAGGSPIPGGGYHIEKKNVATVVVPARVIISRGLIEVLGCAEGGKEHESVLRIETDIQALNLALILSRFTAGPVPEKLGQEGNQGSRVLVLVQWKHDGKLVTHRAEDLVINVKRRGPMPRVGWTYVGAFVEVENPIAPNKKEKQKVLAATGSRSLITTWRDPSTLLDNPLPDAIDDTAYAANHVLLPESGTVVALIVRAPTKDESAAITKLEGELK
jgi:hypothetical protein